MAEFAKHGYLCGRRTRNRTTIWSGLIYSSECKILQFGIPFFPNTVATSEEVPVFTVTEKNMNQKPHLWSCCYSLGDVAIELQQQSFGSI